MKPRQQNTIVALSKSEKNSFYVYFKERIKEVSEMFMAIPYYPKSIHFAMMANSNPDFIRLIRQFGLKVFVNSALHLELAQEIGYQKDEIVFAASAMNDDLMTSVKDAGATLILDSLGQFKRWNSLFPDQKVGLRCNIGDSVKAKESIAGYFIGQESRLGLTPDELQQLAGHGQIEGLHVYVGTNITDVDYFIYCYEEIIRLTQLFPSISYLDFGGGFGLDETGESIFDFEAYYKKVSGLMSKLSNQLGKEIKLMLEPGRIIGGDAGFFVCKVVDVKKRNGKQLIGVNASSVQFPRPLLYPDKTFHPVTLLNNNGRETKINDQQDSIIYGCSTYSRDFLAKNIQLPKARPDDIVVLGYAGSYSASAYTSFLGFPPAKEIFV
jgi:diaminopimelate decarboxylase